MPFTVLIVHPWKLLTDHRANGDGLLGYGFVRRLAERGHRLHVACRAVDLAEPLPAGVTLHHLGSGERDLGVRERITFMRRLRWIYDRIAVSEQIDVVHQTSPVEAGVSLALAGTAAPVVLGPYWVDWPGTYTPAAALARRAARSVHQRQAAALLITTEAARSKLHVHDVPVALVPPGVDLTAFPRRSQLGASSRPPTAVFLANLRAHKGIFTLLDAFDAVAQRLPDARLIVAGGGPDETAVHRRVEHSPAASRIELVGPVAPSQVPAVLSRADVSCQPAHGEPFGWSAVEAMACGLPVIVTDAGGLASVVPDEAGLKVPVGDVHGLAAALETLLGDRVRGAAMGAAGRRAVATTFDWPRVIDRLEAVYANACSARSKAMT